MKGEAMDKKKNAREKLKKVAEVLGAAVLIIGATGAVWLVSSGALEDDAVFIENIPDWFKSNN